MSISRQNLTVIIVTFKSENVIDNCIQSIGDKVKILVVDNSNSKLLKSNLEKKYKNVSCILSENNVGMGAGNNIGIRNIKTDFALILNPDVVLDSNTIELLISETNKLKSFGIAAPIETNENYPNFKSKKNTSNNNDEMEPFEVQSVDGYAMLLNLKRINELEKFNYFDENFFMYLENDDLCRRIFNQNEKIYIIPKSKIKHLGGMAVDKTYEYEIELSRNWHWIWSKFYFNKKHHGFLFAFLNGTPTFCSSLLKFLFFLMTNNQKRKDIYLKRLLGFLNALFGKPSHYRPKVGI